MRIHTAVAASSCQMMRDSSLSRTSTVFTTKPMSQCLSTPRILSAWHARKSMPSLSTAHLRFRSVSHSSLPLFITTNMSESCITVLRVEDGKLADLDSLFRDVFRSHGGPVGHIPQGSVVMAGSVTLDIPVLLWPVLLYGGASVY